jgi:hypothetical protein
MYFRLELIVLPLPFFLIYMAAWPAQAAGLLLAQAAGRGSLDLK